MRNVILCILVSVSSLTAAGGATLAPDTSRLLELPQAPPAPATDWLLDVSPYTAGVYRTGHPSQIVLCNGLIRRTFRLAPNGATVGLDNLMTDQAVIRGVKPEAIVEIDGVRYDVGGLKGQPNYAYLTPDWLDVGTDRSASWGPGIALVFEDRVVKFHFRPGGGAYGEYPSFGAFDGGVESAPVGPTAFISTYQTTTTSPVRASAAWATAR